MTVSTSQFRIRLKVGDLKQFSSPACAMMSTAYPFHYCRVGRAPLPHRTSLLTGMIGCGVAPLRSLPCVESFKCVMRASEPQHIILRLVIWSFVAGWGAWVKRLIWAPSNPLHDLAVLDVACADLFIRYLVWTRRFENKVGSLWLDAIEN